MKRFFSFVYLKYIYKLIGKAIDLYADMRDEFEAEKEKDKKEIHVVDAEIIE